MLPFNATYYLFVEVSVGLVSKKQFPCLNKSQALNPEVVLQFCTRGTKKDV